MKKLMMWTVWFCMFLVGVSVAMAGDCRTDAVARRWLDERNKAEVWILQSWARGDATDQYTSKIALILANELYLCSACRDDRTFLESNLHVLGKSTEPTVATMPGMILERFLGKGFLSPRKDY